MNLTRFFAACAALLLAASAFAADTPTVTFNGTTFTLALAESKDTFTLNEYTLPGQSLTASPQLVSVGWWPSAQAPIQTVSALLKAAQPFLVAKPQVVGGPDGAKSSDLAVVLVQGDANHQNLEIDLQRHVKEP
ncbi:MAG: hypothetical protein ABSH19_09460, partial [Opitutales bacterium]